MNWDIVGFVVFIGLVLSLLFIVCMGGDDEYIPNYTGPATVQALWAMQEADARYLRRLHNERIGSTMHVKAVRAQAPITRVDISISHQEANELRAVLAHTRANFGSVSYAPYRGTIDMLYHALCTELES